MKDYPSIEGPNKAPHLPCIAFEKYDGSNLRFEWERKKGWHLFGTRRRLFDKSDPEYGCAIDIFLQKYASGIEAVIKKEKHFRQCKEVICYGEFFGPASFGGQHDITHPAVCWNGATTNDPKDVVLFDINVHRKGFLTARQFVNMIGHLPIAKVIYEGNLNASFIEDVRQGKYPVCEGVVAKGCNGEAPHGIWMRKIKTLAYLEELKRRFASDWEQFWE